MSTDNVPPRGAFPGSGIRLTLFGAGVAAGVAAGIWGIMNGEENFPLALLGAGVLLMYLGYSGQRMQKLGVGKDGMSVEFAEGLIAVLDADDPKSKTEAAARLGAATLKGASGGLEPAVAKAAIRAIDRKEQATRYEKELEDQLSIICGRHNDWTLRSSMAAYDFAITNGAPGKELHVEAKWSLDPPNDTRLKQWIANVSRAGDDFLLVINRSPLGSVPHNVFVWRAGDEHENLEEKINELLQ